MAQLKERTALSSSAQQSLDSLTLHRSPRLQGGLRQDELWCWLRQNVVAQNLLTRRWWSRRRTNCGQKHRRCLLVLRPHWCRLVEVLEASRDLRTENGRSFRDEQRRREDSCVQYVTF